MWSKLASPRLGLRTKIILFGLLPAFLVLAGISLFSLYEMRSLLLNLQRDEVVDELRAAALQIERQAGRSEVMVRTMALAQEVGMFGRREESVAFAREVLDKSRFLRAVYFGYEPNADGQDAAALRSNLDRRSMDGAGRFAPYWHRDPDDRSSLELKPLSNMETGLFYAGTRNRQLGRPESEGILFSDLLAGDKPMPMNQAISRFADTKTERPDTLMVTEPHIYEGDYVVELTYPIVIGGQFKGIVGVNWSLDDLVGFLEQQKTFPSAEFILLSRRGRIISSTAQPEMLARKIEDVALHELLRQVYIDPSTHGRAFRALDPDLDAPFYYAATRVPALGWTLLLRVNHQDIEGPIQNTLMRAGLLTLLGLAAVFLLLVSAANLVIRRIQTAAQAARQVASGDLTVQVDSAVQDETGDLLRAIKGMVRDLGSLVGKVKTNSIQLVSTATQIGAAAKQQENVVKDFGASTARIATAVTEISATSSELVHTMEDVSAAAQETVARVDHGRSSLRDMSDAIEKLAASTAAITSSLAIINEKATNIGSVITTITKVADQTNLLSLNAAIEAEKAGSYGAGFAVVAREIRRLADQTAVATLDIEQMVRDMQSSVATGVMHMDKFNQEVRRRAHQTETLSAGLTEIIEQVRALLPRFDQVHEGMQSQSQGAQQISEAMRQLTESARGSAAALREFNQAANQLHDAVRALKEEVSRFTM